MKLSLVIAFVGCLTVVEAQKKIAFGFRAGVSLSNFYDHQVDGSIPEVSFVISPWPVPPTSSSDKPYYYESGFGEDLRAGFFSYFSLSVPLTNRIVLEAALGYAQKGINMGYGFQSQTTTADNSTEMFYYQISRNIRLDYISVPVTLQYHVGHKQRMYVLGGIYEGMAIGVRLKDTKVAAQKTTTSIYGGVSHETFNSYETESYTRRFDAGLVGGLGAMLPMSPKVDVGIEARCMLGMMNLPAKFETHGYHSFAETAKNISFEIGIKLQQRLSGN